LTRPIIARLRSESHLNDRITSRGTHQSLSQQNLPKTDLRSAAKWFLFDPARRGGSLSRMSLPFY
jgi:hypothetical protein